MDLEKKKIFLVDDDPFLINMYARKLNHSGFEVETAENGLVALQKLQNNYLPDVMLIDILMPGMDGIELIKKIKEARIAPRAKLVVLTNESGAEQIRVAKDLQVDGYIIKATTIPFEVVSKVREILSGKKIIADSI